MKQSPDNNLVAMRLTIDLEQKAADTLIKLITKIHGEVNGNTATDVVKRALVLYKYVTGVKNFGAVIKVHYPSGKVEVLEI